MNADKIIWENAMPSVARRLVVLAAPVLAAAALAAATLPLSSGPALAEPVKIRIGWSTMPGHMIPVLYSKPEILKHYGKSYTVEPILFRGSSPQITAMAAGEIDMAAFSALTLVLAVTNARQDVKVVADIIQDGVDDYHSETFMVRADFGINTVADMKGKRVASNAIGRRPTPPSGRCSRRTT